MDILERGPRSAAGTAMNFCMRSYENPYPRQQHEYLAPVHATNYHAAHPSISYGMARYATQSSYSQSQTYAHLGLGNEVDPPASHLDNH